jgi:hypothetical protein
MIYEEEYMRVCPGSTLNSWIIPDGAMLAPGRFMERVKMRVKKPFDRHH